MQPPETIATIKENKSLLTPLWFNLAMSLAALFFLVDYIRLILTGDDSVTVLGAVYRLGE